MGRRRRRSYLRPLEPLPRQRLCQGEGRSFASTVRVDVPAAAPITRSWSGNSGAMGPPISTAWSRSSIRASGIDRPRIVPACDDYYWNLCLMLTSSFGLISMFCEYGVNEVFFTSIRYLPGASLYCFNGGDTPIDLPQP